MSGIRRYQGGGLDRRLRGGCGGEVGSFAASERSLERGNVGRRGRVICAQCLGRLAQRGKATSRLMRGAAACVAAGAGLVAAWAVFYYLGQLLLRLPTPFHEGTLWSN